MRRHMPEFAAIPLVIVVLGLVFIVMFVADAGLAAMVVFGVVATVAIVAVAVIAMRRPRGSIVSSGSTVFEGGAPPLEDGVHRVLLVADSAYATADLEDVTANGGEGGTAVFVVVPAVSSRVARWTGDEHAYERAKEHLDATLLALTDLGLQAAGQVGPHDPLQATDDGLREFPAAEIVFALRGDGESEWLERGMVDIGRRRYAVPVRELEANERRDAR
jgi:hypothetical protein